MRPFGPSLLLASACLSLLWSPQTASALDPARSLAQYHHTAWTFKDGMPPNTFAIDQTPDGFLWLGSSTGLYRFDGVRAERIGADRLPDPHVTSLAASDAGDLWVGFAPGLLGRVNGSAIEIFTPPPLPSNLDLIRYLAPDRGGVVWVGTQDNVLRFDGREWRLIGGAWPHGYTYADPGGVWGLAVGRDGTVWAKNRLALYDLRPGAARFEPAPGYAGGIIDFARAPDGRLWTADTASRRFYALPDLKPGEPVPPPDFGAIRPPPILGSVMLDRDGALWVANRTMLGLYRVGSVTHASEVERYRTRDDTTSESVVKAFEDREGNVWIASALGLDRFRAANIVLEPTIPIRHQAEELVATGDAVFVYTGLFPGIANQSPGPQRLYRIPASGAPELLSPDIGRVFAMAATPAGDVLLAADGKLLRWRAGALTRVALPPEIEGGHVNDMAASNEEIWVSVYGKGAYRWRSGRWEHVAAPSALPGDAPEVDIDGQGAAWLFYSGDLMARVMEDRIVEIPPATSTEIGTVSATAADGDALILSGGRGLARCDGPACQVIPVASGSPLATTYGMAETRDGDLWLATVVGVVRIARPDLQGAFAHPGSTLRYRMFDAADGFTGPGAADVFNNTIVRGPDDRFWVMTLSGVAWIDPNHLYRNTVPPPVVVLSISANGRSYDRPTRLTLPQGTSDLEVDYTALSLAVPERVRFRYRLNGVDADWVDAGGRRQAFYTRLGPGEYRFQVVAANNDGVWNEAGAAVQLTLLPAFYQSGWFMALCVAAGAACLYILYLLRVRQVTHAVLGRMQERLAERERIARDLHDTLLQSVQGLILKFQALANRVPREEPMRRAIETTLDRADRVVAEGRARVRDLRDGTLTLHDLAAAFQRVADEHAGGQAKAFTAAVEGSERELHPMVLEESYAIGREALLNALTHSEGAQVEIEIGYGPKQFRLRVRDDGRGIDPAVLEKGGREDHFGLRGMRERARKIGAHLELSSKPGSGTEVALTVPAAAAYASRGRAGRSWLSRLRKQAS